ncbi:MAG: protein-N(pi)-phosphohistidine--sugar phosphotransferase [Blautia sp.]
MKKKITSAGRFYSQVILHVITLFIVFGILNILFAQNGWFPSQKMQQMNEILYRILIPAFMGYEAGKRTGHGVGGVSGALASLGMIAAWEGWSFLGVMLIAPLAGYVGEQVCERLKKRAAGFEMLTRNLVLAILGIFFMSVSCFFVAPVLHLVGDTINQWVKFLVEKQMIPFISVFLEPAKVIFLNNGIHYGILVPLGMEQLQTESSSVLFLLETNPGPGLGLLLACKLAGTAEKRELNSCMLVEFAGGIHEVYFPYVLRNLWLLIPLIAGGTAGSFCFTMTGAGLAGPASPGSIFTLLLMGTRGTHGGILLGVACSAFVSCSMGLLVLKRTQKQVQEEGEEKQGKERKEEVKEEKQVQEEKHMETEKRTVIKNICFVCDGGVGSSSMGAALFRRKLKEMGMEGYKVQAAAADDIPKEAQLLICQKDFLSVVENRKFSLPVCAVTGLMCVEEYEGIIREYLSFR